MHSLVFVDLDDTLFQTLRKCGDSEVLQPRAYLKDGSVISYATPKQIWLWQWLNQADVIIPVTARNHDALSRVDLPFAHEAVINHGAVVLDKQGNLDSTWQAYMNETLPAYTLELKDLWLAVDAYAAKHPGLKPRLVDDFSITWYGVIKHEQADAADAALNDLLQAVIVKHPAVINQRLYCHVNGNNLAVIPKIINKADAVNYLLDQYRQQYTDLISFGIGDSKTDLPFMRLCDYAMVPQKSQLGAAYL